jgi:hypothetical protein
MDNGCESYYAGEEVRVLHQWNGKLDQLGDVDCCLNSLCSVDVV